ncbi:class I SAM-dependent methyltransferase [Alphaproteobacteria bacterium]|nr:class I SAM-dependent methyltransferase [Alphaproteobacteria bacterium]
MEAQYDKLSGSYIEDNYYGHRERFAVSGGVVKKISTVDNMKEIRREIRDVLSPLEFKNTLEVGVGELTTLEDIYKFKGIDLDCYGIDLSLNRLSHGLEEFEKRHNSLPRVAKANATKLPFPSDSFDLVYTRHTLEQIPDKYSDALDEIVRVSRRYIVLFEPSFELGSFPQKLKMLNSDYVRGLRKYFTNKKDVCLKKAYLMQNSANPLNHTACYVLEVNKSVEKRMEGTVPFLCPKSLCELENFGSFLFSSGSNSAYPIINNIPVLDEKYSVRLNKLLVNKR